MGAEAAVLRAAGKTVLFAYEVCARTQAILSQVLLYIMLYFVAVFCCQYAVFCVIC